MKSPFRDGANGLAVLDVRQHRGIIVAFVAALSLFAATSTAHANVLLGTTESYAILAGQSVTNTGTTTIQGDIGIHPGAAVAPNVTGFGTVTHTGTLNDTTAVAAAAKVDLVAAYDDAAGRALTATISRELSGANLGPGVYASSPGGDFLLSSGGVLTLTGNATDVWIFKSTSTLIFESASQVVLQGVDPCNVYWQVASSATLGVNANVTGTIMALTSISLQTGASLDGRALARNGSVTLDSNDISVQVCSAAAPIVTEPDTDVDTDTDTEPVPESSENGGTEAPATVQVPTSINAGGGTQTALGGTAQALLIALAAVAVSAAVVVRRKVTSKT
ncbi:MAG: ice-binding family protein [Nitriliruptoraceae bacterium]